MRKISTVGVLAMGMLLFAMGAAADDVQILGGFTSFTGVIGGNNAPSYINGQQYCPDAGCQVLTDVAHISLGIPQSAVSFQIGTAADGITPNLVRFTAAAPQSVAGPGIQFLLGTLRSRMASGPEMPISDSSYSLFPVIRR